MRLITSLIPNEAETGTAPASEKIDVAVVIDVLRATSVATVAIAAGATEIVTCREIADARARALPGAVDAESTAPSLLCGERECRPIDGFQFGNSPAEYTAEKVAGQRLILTTTNGTRAVEAASSADSIMLASFLNLSAVVDAILGAGTVHVVCAGTNGMVTGEDAMLAGAIIDRCQTRLGSALEFDDASAMAKAWWHARQPHPSPTSLAVAFSETAGGRNLIRVGYKSDLARCAAIDTVPLVPVRTRKSPTGFTTV
ncbi:MAG: 2-phosphosulfolactate phosphatase [Rubripirellula sp.]